MECVNLSKPSTFLTWYILYDIDSVDSYLVQVNNDTGEVTAVEVMDKKSIKLADSIEDLLYNMKGIW